MKLAPAFFALTVAFAGFVRPALAAEPFDAKMAAEAAKVVGHCEGASEDPTPKLKPFVDYAAAHGIEGARAECSLSAIKEKEILPILLVYASDGRVYYAHFKRKAGKKFAAREVIVDEKNADGTVNRKTVWPAKKAK